MMLCGFTNVLQRVPEAGGYMLCGVFVDVCWSICAACLQDAPCLLAGKACNNNNNNNLCSVKELRARWVAGAEVCGEAGVAGGDGRPGVPARRRPALTCPLWAAPAARPGCLPLKSQAVLNHYRTFDSF